MGCIAGAVGLAEGVATGNQRDGLLVVHCHAGEGFANIPRRSAWVRVAIRSLRIDVDKAHLHGTQRLGEISFARITKVAAEPRLFIAPEHILIRFPHILAAPTETEGLESHGL